MLNGPEASDLTKSRRNRQREKKLWHDGRHNTLPFGCLRCPDRDTCGGLQIERTLYDCLDLCCKDPETCDSVCPYRGEFARRVREVQGFPFDNVPRAARLPEPDLPPVVPILYNGSGRESPFTAPAVCLPLYSLIGRRGGKARYADAAAVAQAFRFDAGMPVILTGVAEDAPLERWWNLGPGRLEAIRGLRDLGVSLVTTPNFSLFTDRPRWDDMHSMKRIAITHEEFLREGLPAALHVNARTEHDWERWTEYISSRNEVTHVSFEFGTGAGWTDRRNWHASQLAALAQNVGRTLHLIVRGEGTESGILQRLFAAFDETTILETMSFIKTIKRQRATRAVAGRLRWRPYPTEPGDPVDQLLEHNWTLVSEGYDSVVGYAHTT